MRFWGLGSKPDLSEKEKKVRVKVNFFGGVSVDPDEVIASDEYKESVSQAKKIEEISRKLENSESTK